MSIYAINGGGPNPIKTGGASYKYYTSLSEAEQLQTDMQVTKEKVHVMLQMRPKVKYLYGCLMGYLTFFIFIGGILILKLKGLI